MKDPELHSEDMRREIRQAVHDNRNVATQAKWESRRAAQESKKAISAAHNAIFKLEQAREARRSNEIPPN
jgi:hypothetical protein